MPHSTLGMTFVDGLLWNSIANEGIRENR